MTYPVEAVMAAAGFTPREITPLTGDVSPRRYSRVTLEDGGSAILATYPLEIQTTGLRFLSTTHVLADAGVRVPRVLLSDCESGWMLIEDLGPQTLGEWGQGRPWSELAPWFDTALEIARRIARLPASPASGPLKQNPRLGTEMLRRELTQTWDLFLEPRGLLVDADLALDLHAALDTLCATLGGEPPVPCHRDFMVRNLMPLPGGELAVLDHQDLRLGPPLYDAASLLNDTLFPPAGAEEALVAAMTRPGDRDRYHRAAAQRTLKAVGTYASFARRGATRHLPLIPPTLSRFVKNFSRLPEGGPLAGRLAAAWSHEWRDEPEPPAG
ncbi:MAG TPA: phosphotransferase [Thermoanaerobaculia bacterium]|jgi:aminoglycoside/choline kinase family phosphotransferase|nr:phosphotransferase [Thermoanaerobaculia bacterium]